MFELNSTALTIIGIAAGIIATIAVGFFTIRFAISLRYPGKITFILEDNIELFDEIVRNLEDLSVIYKSNPVSEHVVLLKAFFLNNGTKDITPEMVEDPITVTLPTGYKWLDHKVTASSPGVDCDTSVNNDINLIFRLGLFRCNEYVRFEALAELIPDSPENKSEDAISGHNLGEQLHRVLQFKHRISDTRPIQDRGLPTELSPQQSMRLFLVLALLLSATIGVAIFAFLNFWGPLIDKEIHYTVKTDDGTLIEVKASPQSGDILKLEGIGTSFSKKVTLSEFFSGCNCGPNIAQDSSISTDRWEAVGILSFYVLSMIIIVSYSFFEHWKRKKLMRILGIDH